MDTGDNNAVYNGAVSDVNCTCSSVLASMECCIVSSWGTSQTSSLSSSSATNKRITTLSCSYSDPRHQYEYDNVICVNAALRYYVLSVPTIVALLQY